MRIKTILLLSSFSITFSAWAKSPPKRSPQSSTSSLAIVSDLDDTLKISDVLHKGELIKNALFKSAVFAGMPELYGELYRNGSHSADSEAYLAIVSGSPPALSHLIEDLLAKNAVVYNELFTRDWSKFPEIFTFKQQVLKQLLLPSRDGPIILFGDDTEKDHEIYEDFAKNYRGLKKPAIYIRQIKGRALPEGQIGFRTAFDVAIVETLKNYIGVNSAIKVGEAILAAKEDLVITPFASCPTDVPSAILQNPKLQSMKLQVDAIVKRVCAKR